MLLEGIEEKEDAYLKRFNDETIKKHGDKLKNMFRHKVKISEKAAKSSKKVDSLISKWRFGSESDYRDFFTERTRKQYNLGTAKKIEKPEAEDFEDLELKNVPTNINKIGKAPDQEKKLKFGDLKVSAKEQYDTAKADYEGKVLAKEKYLEKHEKDFREADLVKKGRVAEELKSKIEETYKEYMKASEVWKQNSKSGIGTDDMETADFYDLNTADSVLRKSREEKRKALIALARELERFSKDLMGSKAFIDYFQHSPFSPQAERDLKQLPKTIKATIASNNPIEYSNLGKKVNSIFSQVMKLKFIFDKDREKGRKEGDFYKTENSVALNKNRIARAEEERSRVEGGLTKDEIKEIEKKKQQISWKIEKYNSRRKKLVETGKGTAEGTKVADRQKAIKDADLTISKLQTALKNLEDSMKPLGEKEKKEKLQQLDQQVAAANRILDEIKNGKFKAASRDRIASGVPIKANEELYGKEGGLKKEADGIKVRLGDKKDKEDKSAVEELDDLRKIKKDDYSAIKKEIEKVFRDSNLVALSSNKNNASYGGSRNIRKPTEEDFSHIKDKEATGEKPGKARKRSYDDFKDLYDFYENGEKAAIDGGEALAILDDIKSNGISLLTAIKNGIRKSTPKKAQKFAAASAKKEGEISSDVKKVDDAVKELSTRNENKLKSNKDADDKMIKIEDMKVLGRVKARKLLKDAKDIKTIKNIRSYNEDGKVKNVQMYLIKADNEEFWVPVNTYRIGTTALIKEFPALSK